jgi:putative phosphoesterase
MKICIASDSHDNWPALTEAVRLACERGCEVFLFAGDLISPPGVEILARFQGNVHMVLGNNEGELVKLTRLVDATPNVTLHGNLNGGTMELTLDGLRFYMNHYPGNAENAALSGKYDVVIFGHTHEYHEDHMANGVLLINPGEVQGYRTGTPSIIIFDTTTRTLERIDITL